MILPELVDGCNLKCSLCWNRNRDGVGGQMDFAIAEKILDLYGTSKQEIAWFNWGEPMLYKKLEQLSKIVIGTKSSISSNFSLKISEKKIKCLKNFDKIIISISGLNQGTYQIYHQGGILETVEKNIEKLSGIGANRVIFRWLAHKLNQHQKDEAILYAKKLGFEFEFTPITYDVEDLLNDNDNGKFPYNLTEIVSRNRSRCKIINRTPIDIKGNYLLCCATHNVKIGLNIYDKVTSEELVEARKKTEMCKKCHAINGWRIF